MSSNALKPESKHAQKYVNYRHVFVIFKALIYVMNHRKTFMAYLEDGCCSFTNNLGEMLSELSQ